MRRRWIAATAVVVVAVALLAGCGSAPSAAQPDAAITAVTEGLAVADACDVARPVVLSGVDPPPAVERKRTPLTPALAATWRHLADLADTPAALAETQAHCRPLLQMWFAPGAVQDQVDAIQDGLADHNFLSTVGTESIADFTLVSASAASVVLDVGDQTSSVLISFLEDPPTAELVEGVTQEQVEVDRLSGRWLITAIGPVS